MEATKTPLKVYVLWHKDFENGREYADVLYNEFSRKEDDFAGESLGIPIYFLNKPAMDFGVIASGAQHIAFILLVNSKMALDAEWQKFVYSLCDFAESNSNVKIYPVSISSIKTCNTIAHKIAKINFIQLADIAKFESDKYLKFKEKAYYLCFEIAHELSRLLFKRERASYDEQPNIPPAVRIFLSHARIDGKNYADELNDYLSTNTPLDRFIDVYNIPKGEDFEKTINRYLDGSALLILYTDAYSSREWCQHEALYAKYKGRPIVLVDALEKGEPRRFPYIANVKTIHLGHDIISNNKKRDIIYAVLIETLKIKYNELFLAYLESLYNLKKGQTVIFCYPPELYTLLTSLKNESGTNNIFYPEPPLNKNEIRILQTFKPNLNFITPTYILGMKDGINRVALSNINVGISISEISEEGDMQKTNMHLCKMYIELCRYLLALDTNLIYGGDINFPSKNNFIDLLQRLIQHYCFNSDKDGRIKIFYLDCFPIDEEKQAALRPTLIFNEVQVQHDSKITDNQNLIASLSSLRGQINEKCDLRVVIGGKTEGYLGKMPGIIEEAYIASLMNKPIYLIGSYGGAAELIVRCLEGEHPAGVPNELILYFNHLGFGGLNNGLSEEENKSLCHCDDVAQSIALILSGMVRLFSGKNDG